MAESFDLELEACEVPVNGRSTLIKNKRAAGRSQDFADVRALGDK